MSEDAHDPDEQKYRTLLIETEQKSQEDYDKTVLTLSGGALAVSFAFVKDIVGKNPVQRPNWLLAAWICWGVSVCCVLFSFFFSQQALRKAIKQLDEGTIYAVKRPGGWFEKVNITLNALGGILFLIGVICVTIFVYYNFGGCRG